jgi:hypothetical protein
MVGKWRAGGGVVARWRVQSKDQVLKFNVVGRVVGGMQEFREQVVLLPAPAVRHWLKCQIPSPLLAIITRSAAAEIATLNLYVSL